MPDVQSEVRKSLFAHQEAAAAFAANHQGSAALFHEMGLGKTRTAIEIYSRMRESNQSLRLLVIAPLSLLEAAWAEEVKRYGYSYQNLRRFTDWTDPRIHVKIVNFETIIQEKNWKRILELLRDANWMCVVDESSRMKNPKSITAKTILKLRTFFKHRIVMSGTPAPNSEMEYWAQAEFVSPGIFASSFSQFRNSYFHLEDAKGNAIHTNGMIMTKETMRALFQRRGAKYTLTDCNREKIMAKIGGIAHIARKKECLDLPDQIDEKRSVELGPGQKKAYQEMARHLVAEIREKTIAAPAALTKIIKLREIVSGFLLDSERKVAEIGECPKLEVLKEILDELGDKQAIIWCQFKWEIEKIASALSSLGKVNTLYGDTADKDHAISTFISGEAKYLIAHPRSAAHGLTFVNCDTQVFFSMDWSWESYEQARGRTHRIGQTQKCTYVHIIAENTIDEKIFDVVKKKASEQEILYYLTSKYYN